MLDRDFMAPADWSSSPDRKCIFGFRKKPAEVMPSGRYSVFGGPDGQPRFYFIPPDAFAADTQSLKQLSLVRLTVDPEFGCAALGSIGFTADGITYQCPACSFLKSGGACASGDGAHQITLPTGRRHVLDANDTGGAWGFVNYPAVLFRSGFSAYFTGRAGYAPPRTYFESAVDTLAAGVNVRTAAQMTVAQSQEIATQFDGSPESSQLETIAALETDAVASPPGKFSVRPRETGFQSFQTTPGAVLSSVVWTVRPSNNRNNQGYMETNLCLEIDGEGQLFLRASRILQTARSIRRASPDTRAWRARTTAAITRRAILLRVRHLCSRTVASPRACRDPILEQYSTSSSRYASGSRQPL